MKSLKDAYLWQSASGAYYFRQRLPDNLRATLGKPEIKISLKTDSRKEARKLASIYKAELQILSMDGQKIPPTLQEILFINFPQAKKLAESATNPAESLLPKNFQHALGVIDDAEQTSVE